MGRASKLKKLQRARKRDWAKRKFVQPDGRKRRNQEAAIRYRQRLRATVLMYYGGKRPKCACCGEVNYRFLTIDHMNGNGNQHRKSLGCWGIHFYRWLIQQGFPTGYQVLCWNCNLGRSLFEMCPHEMAFEWLVAPAKRPVGRGRRYRA